MRLLVCAVLLSLSSFAGNFVSGTTTCPASGTKLVVTLSAPSQVSILIVQAQYANLGTITIGSSNITSSSNGFLMNPGDSFSVATPSKAGIGTSQIFIACSNSNDKVNWSYIQ